MNRSILVRNLVVLIWILAAILFSLDNTRLLAAGSPPPPLPVPPNGSHVTGTVLSISVWPPGSLEGKLPRISSTVTLNSVRVEIRTSEAEREGLESFAVPGTTYEAFSETGFNSDIIGRTIEATLVLTGDTRGVRWFISGIHVLP